MASLEDVKRYAREHAEDDRERLEARIAKEFEMTREEAARVVNTLVDETGAMANTYDPQVAGAAAGTTAIGNPAIGVFAAAEIAREGDQGSGAHPIEPNVIAPEGERPDGTESD